MSCFKLFRNSVASGVILCAFLSTFAFANAVDPKEISSNEPEQIGAVSIEADPAQISQYEKDPVVTEQANMEFEKLFGIPEGAVPDAEMWKDVATAELALRQQVAELVKKGIAIGSDEFTKLANADKIEVRTEKATAGLTLINNAVCVRVTHHETEDAFLIGPREVLNPQLPRDSHFQKYISKIFTFSGRNTDYKVRSRNVYLVRIASANEAESVEIDYLKKPLKWISWGWYKHYFNAAFSKPTAKMRNSAIFSTLLEIGALYGLNQMALMHNPDATAVTLTAGIFAGTYSLTYGLFANGIRLINQFGRSKFVRGLKASAWTLAYSVPFAYLVGQENVLSVVGISFVANKTADVHWSQITRFDDQLRTMPGDYIVPEYMGMDKDFSWKGKSILKMSFKVKVPSFIAGANMGSRVNMKNIFLRMPRFVLKALSIIEPTVGVTALLISIPVMSVIAYNYAVKKMESGHINRQAAQEFIDKELMNIWVRAWEALKAASSKAVRGHFVDSWAFVRGFFSLEYQLTKTSAQDLGARALTFVRQAPSRTMRFGKKVLKIAATKSLRMIVNSAHFAKAEIDLMLDYAAMAFVDTVDRVTNKAEDVVGKLYDFGQGLKAYVLMQGLVHAGELKETPVKVLAPQHIEKRMSSCRQFLVNI